MVQVDDATGEQVEFPDGDATVLVSRKVMVEFAPEPLHDGDLAPVMFVKDDEVATVTVVFEANPPPEDNEVRNSGRVGQFHIKMLFDHFT